MKKKICIIGCGTFGSYLAKRLLERHSESIEITIIEIGNKKTQTESEIGLGSISENSTVSRDGRYFGLGGTSARWGGQVLFFDKRENYNNDATWNRIVNINEKYKNTVINKLLGGNEKYKLPQDKNNIKTGIWLKYTKRNLFNRLNKKDLKKINLRSDLRVIGFTFNNDKISKLICRSKNGQTEKITADIFYLTAGTLESCRLLMQLDKNVGLLKNTDLGKNFGDHISTELFHVHQSAPVINGVDFTPHLYKGSLITKRMIVRTDDGVFGFLHCVFNKNIKSFKFLKELLFGKRTTTVTFSEFIGGFVFLFKFVFHLLFKQKLYVDKKLWSLQLDMEQAFPNANKLSLAGNKDQYGENILRIDWDISEHDLDSISEMRKKTELLLQKNNLKFTSLYNPASTSNKVEDVYHPVGCLRMGIDEKAVVNFNCQVKNIKNLFHFSTGIFPSARSINPSAAVCCFIEEHLENWEET